MDGSHGLSTSSLTYNSVKIHENFDVDSATTVPAWPTHLEAAPVAPSDDQRSYQSSPSLATNTVQPSAAPSFMVSEARTSLTYKLEALERFSTPARHSRTDVRPLLEKTSKGGLQDIWLRSQTFWGSMCKMAHSSPVTFIVPALVLLILVVGGEVAAWCEARAVSQQLHKSTNEEAQAAASQLEFLILSWMSPSIAAASIVRKQPQVPILQQNMSDWAGPIVDYLLPSNDTRVSRLTMYPWGLYSGAYPAPRSNNQMLNLNLFSTPSFKYTSIASAGGAPGQVDLLGPIQLLDGAPGFCMAVNVWVQTKDPNSTWGMDQPFHVPWAPTAVLGNATHPMYGPCGSACTPRKQPDGSYWVYWGIICNSVYQEQLSDRLSVLENAYKIRLYRTDSAEIDAIFQNALSTDQNTLAAASHEVFVSAGGEACRSPGKCECRAVGTETTLRVKWEICLMPKDGYTPQWLRPAQISVVIFALVVSVLTVMLTVSMEHHRVLVQAMLPKKVIRHLALGKTYAEPFRSVTILFSDIVSYTSLSTELPPEDLVQMLNALYLGFDDLADKHKLYKVETIGDAFMCVGGAPESCGPRDAARRVAQMALDMIHFANNFKPSCGRRIQIRVGMHTGDVCAAVIGRKMPHWCLVGDTVNVSSRMESNSTAMQIHVSASTAALLAQFPEEFVLEPRGCIDIKGKGPMQTYWLHARHPQPSPVPEIAQSRQIDDCTSC